MATQGNLATVTKVVPQCGIQMAVYDYVKDILQAKHPDNKLGNIERLTAGERLGGALTAWFLLPVEASHEVPRDQLERLPRHHLRYAVHVTVSPARRGCGRGSQHNLHIPDGELEVMGVLLSGAACHDVRTAALPAHTGASTTGSRGAQALVMRWYEHE